MHRFVLLAMSALVVALTFVPAAMAQQMGNDMMMKEQMMSRASASAMSSASASAMGDEMMSASATAPANSQLPGTGGTPLAPVFSVLAVATMLGSGIIASRMVRRSS